MHELLMLPSDTREQRLEGITKIIDFFNKEAASSQNPYTETKIKQIIIFDQLSLSTPYTIEQKLHIMQRIINFFKTLPPENSLPINIQEWKIIIMDFFMASPPPSSITLPLNNSEKEIIIKMMIEELLSTESPFEEKAPSKEMLALLIGLNQLPLLPSNIEEHKVELIKRATENFLKISSSTEEEKPNQEMIKIIIRLNKLLISSLNIQEQQLKASIAVLSFLNKIPFEDLEEYIREIKSMRKIKMELDKASFLPQEQRKETVVTILTQALHSLSLEDEQRRKDQGQ